MTENELFDAARVTRKYGFQYDLEIDDIKRLVHLVTRHPSVRYFTIDTFLEPSEGMYSITWRCIGCRKIYRMSIYREYLRSFRGCVDHFADVIIKEIESHYCEYKIYQPSPMQFSPIDYVENEKFKGEIDKILEL
jgi:hypothetical protein